MIFCVNKNILINKFMILLNGRMKNEKIQDEIRWTKINE